MDDQQIIKLKEYCRSHGIDFESLIKIINEPKVVPMIRGIGFEYVVEKDLKERFRNSDRYEIRKPNINAQLGKPDVDVEIFDLEKNQSLRMECKLAKNNSFKQKGKLSKNPHCQIKVMRSRTLGEKNIQVVAKQEGIDPQLLREHKDSYSFDHFDFVITNLRNAFYRTIDGSFMFAPTEEEEVFLKDFLNTDDSEEMNKLLIENHFFIESKKLIAKDNDILCRKKVCSDRENCIFIPNYPIFDLIQNTQWKPLSQLEEYLNLNF